MNRKLIIFKNSAMGIISQVSSILFTFITRRLFIQYIGVEMLGINSTFSSILSTLSLTELGFQSAIVFSLYKPLRDDNTEEINDIINILKIIYRFIGSLFIVSAFVMMPFLKYILNGVSISNKIYLYFILQMLTPACSYFLAYKRSLLYADQKEYISKMYDTAVNFILNILICFAIYLFHSYAMYLSFYILKTVISNVLVHVYCTKNYTYLHNVKFNWDKFKKIWVNVKNIFWGRVAGYIYSSTDDLIISAFVSTISVGYLANYKTVLASINGLIYNMLSPITPIIGNYLAEKGNDSSREDVFLLYGHVRYLITVVTLIPFIILVNDFILIWIGTELFLPVAVLALISIDFYISIVHGVTVDFINASGLFKYSKYVDFVGAFINLFTSLLLVRHLGISGVLIGTICSQMFFWAGRAYITYKFCFNLGRKKLIKYFIKNVIYAVVFVAALLLCRVVYTQITISNPLLHFVCGAVILEIVLLLFILTIFAKDNNQRKLLNIIKEFAGAIRR